MAFLIDSLSADERVEFEEHVRSCGDCRLALEQYRAIIRGGLPEPVGQGSAPDLRLVPSSEPIPWAIEAGEQRLLEDLKNIAASEDALSHSGSAARPSTGRNGSGVWGVRPSRLALAAAACVLFAVFIAAGAKSLRQRQVIQPTASVLSSQTSDSPSAHELTRPREEDLAHLGIEDREARISQLTTELKKAKQRNLTLESELTADRAELADQTHQRSVERDDLSARVESSQSDLANANAKVASLEETAVRNATQIASLEAKNRDLSNLAQERAQRLDQQQALLAADRDIRELMGAREVYMAEVYDVAKNGKLKKPFGRVFYTKAKSLIFYAYDLDQQPGVNTNTSFQAWGMRGPDRADTLNLGILYSDNSTAKRWVLQYSDAKALEQIDAVFVTVEPPGGSKLPSSKPFLFTYLKEEPNHP